METQFCPKCDQDNPLEAVMCWACYTPLKGAQLTPMRCADGALNGEPTRSKSWRSQAEDAAPYLLILGLVSSGWWRGKTRFGVLGTGVGIVALIFAIQEIGERKRRAQQSAPGDEISPIRRIADTILLHGIKDEATAIRISIVGRGVKVDYQIEGEWHEQMKIPLYVWLSLQREFSLRAQNGAVGLSFNASNQTHILGIVPPAAQKVGFGLRISNETPHAEIFLTRMEREIDMEKTPLKLQQCPHCREENLSDAMLCATCYTPLKGARTFTISVNGRKTDVHFPQLPSHWLRGKVGNAVWYSSFGALVSSGWWRGKMRFGVLEWGWESSHLF